METQYANVNTLKVGVEEMSSLVWSRVEVDGRAVSHGTGGSGPQVLFLHGWGLGPSAYRAPLRRLAELGCRVAAPALPGFGRTPELPADERRFAGYAAWAARYLDALESDDPIVVVGHSFGGGVAIQLAHDHPDRVRALVLCNAVGGPAWSGPTGARPMAHRHLWEWGRHFGADLLAPESAARVLPTVLEAVVPNIFQHPLAVWRVGEFVRRADLLDELGVLADRGLPVTVVWADRDRIAPHAGFAALAQAARTPGVTVPGQHNWMLAEPDRFAEVVQGAMAEAGVLDEAYAARFGAAG